jgi:hypothetical protein
LVRVDEFKPTRGNTHALGASTNAVTSAISASTSALVAGFGLELTDAHEVIKRR